MERFRQKVKIFTKDNFTKNPTNIFHTKGSNKTEIGWDNSSVDIENLKIFQGAGAHYKLVNIFYTTSLSVSSLSTRTRRLSNQANRFKFRRFEKFISKMFVGNKENNSEKWNESKSLTFPEKTNQKRLHHTSSTLT